MHEVVVLHMHYHCLYLLHWSSCLFCMCLYICTSASIQKMLKLFFVSSTYNNKWYSYNGNSAAKWRTTINIMRKWDERVYGWHMGKREAYLPSIMFHFVKLIQIQWHHWLQHTIASFFPSCLQCSAGQISLDAFGAAFVIFFGFTT